ncbi:MAG: GNAT family N-acetyltransferase [Nocardioidaceae bacterium]
MSTEGVEVVALDVTDDQQFAAYHSVVVEADGEGHDYPAPWALHELKVMHTRPNRIERLESAVAVRDGEVLGAVDVFSPLLDNLHTAFVFVHVPQRNARQGIGGLLADHSLELVRADGRRSVNAMLTAAKIGPDGSRDRSIDTGSAFAARYGLTERLVNVQRVADLPVDGSMLQRLVDEAANKHRDYEIVAWVGPCPDDYVDSYCTLRSILITEAPMGDLDIEDEAWDEERLREEEEEMAAMERVPSTVAAVAHDGSLVAHTQVVVPMHEPGVVHQWDTLVLPDHRGHRLGLALKARNLVWLADHHPERTWITTWNAESNQAMVAVNDALGFRPVELTAEWQGDVES